MKVISLTNFQPIQACVKFDYKGYEISLSTDNGRPWLAVFQGEFNNPLFICGQHDMLDAIERAKAFIDSKEA